ncbi:Spo0E family sporulation regulatory protein-aspartic acid phosphatase [Niallia oryzisoli]|uniref:Spo0E family sporulation regulatory protein-aspartic acid phosphatase n=1 Tax=Niallia oryzisoli TaxID=1737571 RepID=UPI003736B9AD
MIETMIQIEESINRLKAELVEIWGQKGFLHNDTIEKSQKLDQFIVEYQKLKLLS